MKRMYGLTALMMTGVMSAGVLMTPITAGASEEGKRNTAIGLGALAAALLITQKNKVPGVVAAGAAAYAYKNYDDSIRDRHRRERDWREDYDHDYRRDNNHDYRRDSDTRYQRDGQRDNRYQDGGYRYRENNPDRHAPTRTSRR